MKTVSLIFVVCVTLLASGIVFAQEKGISLIPSRVEADKNSDDKIDHWEFYSDGKLERIEIDSDFDGTVDEKIYFKDGKPYKGERDSDKDGATDTWLYY